MKISVGGRPKAYHSVLVLGHLEVRNVHVR